MRSSITGLLEIHLTADAGVSRLGEFADLCGRLGVKFVNIELDRGLHPSQPMATWHLAGTLALARARAGEVAAALRAAGFAVIRTKIEAEPGSAGVPATAEEARADAGCYFEHHHKLLLRPADDLALLAGLCEAHGARLSINTFKRRDDGQFERFATQRQAGIGAGDAIARAHAFRDDLVRHGYHVLKSVSEYCVFDSALSLDDGWFA